MRTGAAPRRQRTAPPRRAARTRVQTIGAGIVALRNREETKIYLVYLLLCFWYTIFSAPEGPQPAEVPRALSSRQPREQELRIEINARCGRHEIDRAVIARNNPPKTNQNP